jgi:hypothetical protein
MVGAGFEFALGVFLFLLVLLALKRFADAIKRFIDGPTGRKLDTLCRHYPWQIGIGTGLVLMALIVWRTITWHFVLK